jgi:RNA polymerase sigma-70 factor, ECF subfamily
VRRDPAAEQELVQRLRPGLRVLLRGRLGSAAIVDDLVQEALLLILDRWRKHEIPEPQQQIAFAHTTALHLASNATRTEMRRQRLSTDHTSMPGPSAEPSPEEHLEREQLMNSVRRIITELPNERDRALLTRFYLEDQPKEQICTDLDLDRRHFDRVLHRARQRLREFVTRSTLLAGTSPALTTFLDSTVKKP